MEEKRDCVRDAAIAFENPIASAGILVKRLLDCGHIRLCDLEGVGIFKKNSINIAHIPTLMLIIGYPVYWAMLLSRQAASGITSPICWWVFAFFVLFVVLRERKAIAEGMVEFINFYRAQQIAVKFFWWVGAGIGFLILSFAFLASLHPPHLMQESDVMNYHMSLPRQHLILGSFAHIPWSADDFFFLPIDFALAPFWFVSALPNKLPQFIFFLGIIGVIVSLTQWLKRGALTASLVCVFAFLGSHGHGVQMGTGMLDLTVCYLFLALVDSLFRRQKWLFITEFTFFIWAKSLVALQVFILLIMLWLIYQVLRRVGINQVMFDFQKTITALEVKEIRNFLRKAIVGIVLLSLCVAGPFLVKSLYYTGTPFFPVGFGFFKNHPGIAENSVAWESLTRSAQFLTNSISRDGYGRSILDFITHFWALAVPDVGVNNAFDYPMGLSYLIFLGPFMFLLIRSLMNKEVPIIPWLIVSYWILWWLSVRETRHLYAPVILMFIVSAVSMKVWSKIFFGVLAAAMVFNALNVYRAHQPYFFKTSKAVIRAEDLWLAEYSQQYHRQKRSDMVELQQFEVAFALFPVVVRMEYLPHVIVF